MLERFYRYREYEIGVQPELIDDELSSVMPPGTAHYRSIVRIREKGSAEILDTFEIECCHNRPFSNELDAVLQACHAAEQRINFYRAMTT